MPLSGYLFNDNKDQHEPLIYPTKIISGQKYWWLYPIVVFVVFFYILIEVISISSNTSILPSFTSVAVHGGVNTGVYVEEESRTFTFLGYPPPTRLPPSRDISSVISNNTLWGADVYNISGAMELIIAEAKHNLKREQLLPELTEIISGVDLRKGAPPTQEDLRALIFQKCNELNISRRVPPQTKAFFNKKYEIVFIPNPKCGSTSFLKYLSRLSGDATPYDEMKNVHDVDYNPYLQNLYATSESFQKYAFENYFVITTVRNPFVRLVSGYRNKILRQPIGYYMKIIQDIFKEEQGDAATSSRSMRRNFRPSFQQFVEYIIRNEIIYSNFHFAPYSNPIGLCDVRYDMILQLETLEQQLEQLRQKVPSLLNVPFPASRTESNADVFSSEELTILAFSNLTASLRDRVYDIYKDEVNLLGYSVLDDPTFPFLKLANVTVIN